MIKNSKIIQSFGNKSFTLMELMIAALVLALVLVGLLASYISCMQLTEIARNTSLAMNEIRIKVEEIEQQAEQPIVAAHNFSSIEVDYDDISFPLTTSLNGMGVSYVDASNPDLLEITVTVCWRQSRGRVVGEDTNLNGSLDAGEDVSPLNSMLDSPAQVKTYIVSRKIVWP